MISKEKLAFWLENEFNVLIEGRHGVGKSTSVTNFLDDRGINYMYFSCGTMDPWVDFVGVPKERETENGSHLELVRPKPLQQDNVEVMVFDEFNRAKSKVKNAVMELVQFKSINGKKFDNLKAVWALINPSDDKQFDYDVEPLAPAQKDRFHVQVEVPYRPSKEWFVDNFGEAGAGAVSWWKSLPSEQQYKVSPRRLEYALNMLILDGSVRDVFPEGVNISQFRKQVDVGDITKALVSLRKKDKEEIENFFKDQNKYFQTINAIRESKDLIQEYVRYMPEERISGLIQKDDGVLFHVMKNKQEYGRFGNVVEDVLQSEVSSEQFRDKLEKYDKAFNRGEKISYEVSPGDEYVYVEPPKDRRINRDIEDVDKDESNVRSDYQSQLDKAEEVMTDANSNTNKRKRVIEKLCEKFVRGVLSVEQLKNTITDLNNITSGRTLDMFLSRSRVSTVRKFDPFAKLFNSCLADLIQREHVNNESILEGIFDEDGRFHAYIETCNQENEETGLCIIADK